MFRKWYKVQVIVTPKEGTKYSIFKKQKLTKKEAMKLSRTKQCGLYDHAKAYSYIEYVVTRL